MFIKIYFSLLILTFFPFLICCIMVAEEKHNTFVDIIYIFGSSLYLFSVPCFLIYLLLKIIWS